MGTHGGNSASLIGDEYGANLVYREAAFVVKRFYDPLNVIRIKLEDDGPSSSDSDLEAVE